MRTQWLALFLLVAACHHPPPPPPDDLGSDGGVDMTQRDMSRGDMSPPVTCLPMASYANDLVVDSAFPFCVTRRITSPKAVLAARWGRHGGPLVTDGPTVIRYTLPMAAMGSATATSITFKVAGMLPAMFFYGPDGMIDLPFGSYALLSYTSTGTAFPGEALLYAKDYDTVVSRANVNGIYSAVGIANGSSGRIVYSGLSGLTASMSTTSDNGLYGSDVCSGSLVPTAPCTSSRKLLSWTGNSGPVGIDRVDNVFVAASLMGMPSDAVYGLSKAQALGSSTVTATPLVSISTSGTSSIAAVAPQAGKSGWVLAKGYDFGMVSAAYAQAYQVASDRVMPVGMPLMTALKPGPAATGFSLFTDDQGNLWVALEEMTDKLFFQLQANP